MTLWEAWWVRRWEGGGEEEVLDVVKVPGDGIGKRGGAEWGRVAEVAEVGRGWRASAGRDETWGIECVLLVAIVCSGTRLEG